MLEVDSLTKRFGATLAVDGLSFKAEPGRVLGFLGPNGAGKTTTLRTLLGLTIPTSGSATVDGRPYRELSDPVRVLGAVLEGPQFHPGRTGRNNLRVLASAAGLPTGRVDEVLRLVELDGAGGRRVKGYSLGMRQRLSLAGALLGDPRGLVLDEPANGLDPQGIRWLRDFLRARAAEGRTVLAEVADSGRGRCGKPRPAHRPGDGRRAHRRRRRRRVGAEPGARPAARGAAGEGPRARGRPGRLALCAGRDARGGRRHRRGARHRRPRAVPAVAVARGRLPPADPGDGGRPGIRVVASELLKLRTTRTFYGLAGAALALVMLAVVLVLALTDSAFDESDVRSLLSSAGVAGLIALILGVVFSAGEYRHGTIAWTLLVIPVRLRVAAGQALACALAGAAIAAAAAAPTAGVALPPLEGQDAASLSSGEVLGIFAGGILYGALAGAFGAGLGALLRNQVVGVVLVLVFLFVVDPTLTALVDGYDKFSLSGLQTSITGGSEEDFAGEDLLPFGVATLVWLGYTAVLVGAAALLTSRRDI